MPQQRSSAVQTRCLPRPFARFSTPTVTEETTLAVISDIHFATARNGTSKQLHRTPDRFLAALADISTRGVDAVVGLGDLVQRGRPDLYEVLDSGLSRLEVPFFAVPGNHDLFDDPDSPESMLSADAFAARYSTAPYPATFEIGGVTVLGMNVERTGNQEPIGLPPDPIDSPESTILCLHRPLSPAVGAITSYQDSTNDHVIVYEPFDDAPTLEKYITDTGIPLVFTGHLHVPLVAEAIRANGVSATRDWAEVVAPPLCTYPQGYLLVTVARTGTTVEFVPLASQETLREAKHARAACSDTDRALTAIAEEVLTASLANRPVRYPLD